MSFVINVNTKELVKYSKKLDRISKRALPRVVKNTLNSMAFDVKKRTLIEESNKAFINRNKTFFKRFSRVKPVQTLEIHSMQATVGMVDAARAGRSEQAGRNMKQQQRGGRIGGRSLIPLDTARAQGNNSMRVLPRNRVGRIKTVLNTDISRAAKHRQRFIRGAIFAVERFGNSAVIQHTAQNGKTYLYRIKRGGKDIQTRKFNLSVIPLYSVKRGRSVGIQSPVPFTLIASRRSQRKANRIFIKFAKQRISRMR